MSKNVTKVARSKKGAPRRARETFGDAAGHWTWAVLAADGSPVDEAPVSWATAGLAAKAAATAHPGLRIEVED